MWQEIKLAADASAYGLGAVISHSYAEANCICFSHIIRKNYAQIDKEALALVFTVQKFHTYLYERKFVLVTDHKPLVTLRKPYHCWQQLDYSDGP